MLTGLLILVRSCEAGLQVGAAKCQTLTLFASRRTVENYITRHVRAVLWPKWMSNGAVIYVISRRALCCIALSSIDEIAVCRAI